MCPGTTAADVRRQGFLRPLPSNKSTVDVYGDFLRYLLEQTKEHVVEHWPERNGRATWDRLIYHAQFILAHPNDWDGVQQSKLRRAAVVAGLVPDTIPDRARIRFVTEGEASMHYCILAGRVKELSAVTALL
jgi:hypothetical protein